MRTKNKIAKFFMVLYLCVCMTAMTIPVSVSAATTAQKATAAYKKQINSIRAKSGVRYVYYAYADLDGNGIKELICTYNRPAGGSAEVNKIYTYRSGKLVTLLTCEVGRDRWYKIRYSRSAKAFRVYGVGRGIESYSYYKLQNGKYVCKGKKSIASGYGSTKWTYTVNGKTVKKSVYERSVKGTQAGTLRTITL